MTECVRGKQFIFFLFVVLQQQYQQHLYTRWKKPLAFNSNWFKLEKSQIHFCIDDKNILLRSKDTFRSLFHDYFQHFFSISHILLTEKSPTAKSGQIYDWLEMQNIRSRWNITIRQSEMKHYNSLVSWCINIILYQHVNVWKWTISICRFRWVRPNFGWPIYWIHAQQDIVIIIPAVCNYHHHWRRLWSHRICSYNWIANGNMNI